ncbi:MAG TPA: tryptophan 7-halogenase [Vicinamibacterales bacterium]|nr:tryptophan 7-halogenase [Vicinamibacterales bacterium]
MPQEASTCDVLVVGGGPAAGTAARLLSQWGRAVVVVAKPEGSDPELPESLTPSCRKFFELMGISAAIDAAGFVRSSGHTVWWGDDTPRCEPFADGARGWQATTGRLGRVMLDAAAAAGAQVQRATLSAGEILAWPAAYRLDCTGRSGVLARVLGGRTYEPGHRTVALVGVWRQPGGWALDNPTHTLLESYEDGWAWSVPVDEERRALAVMVDPKTTALAKGDGAAAVYLGEMAKTGRLAEIFRGAELQQRPVGWDASMYSVERPAGDTWLLVGDAASFVDPLSSAGVKKAMASGWLAAVTVNTALGSPALKDTAFAHYAARERETYHQFLALTRKYLLDGAPDAENPFWADRGAPPPGDDDRLGVLSAWERIKNAGELRFRPGPGVQVADRPALRERELVLEPRLVDALTPEGVRFVDGVDVVWISLMAPGFRQVPDVFDAYVREVEPVALPSFLKALSTVVAKGWLLLA